jgi:hypothetical protein
MTSPQAFPNPDAQPQSSGTDMGAYAGMMGVGQEQPKVDNARQLQKQQMENAGMQVRSMTQQLDGLARQFPAVANDIKALQRALTMVQVKIVGSQQSESPAPTGQMG